MASLFFFHFSKREKKASSLFIARLRFTAHASASMHTRVSLRWLSRARSFVRSIARAFASRSILARVFVRGLTRSLARSFVHSLARSRPARISHAFFVRGLARSFARSLTRFPKSKSPRDGTLSSPCARNPLRTDASAGSLVGPTCLHSHPIMDAHVKLRTHTRAARTHPTSPLLTIARRG